MSKPLPVLVLEGEAAGLSALLEELQRSGQKLNIKRVSSQTELKDALDSGDWKAVVTGAPAPGPASRAESLLAFEARILEMIASGSPLSATLDALTRGLEELEEGMLSSVLLLDRDGQHLRHGAAPSLNEDYCRAIDGAAIGPAEGSCGTAAFYGKPVIVTDIANDPLWKGYRDLALSHNLKACWSTPIVNERGRVLGTFAMYYHEPKGPADSDNDLIARATNLARIALEREWSELALRKSEEQFETMFHASPVPMCLTTLDGGRIHDVSASFEELLGYSRDELIGKTAKELNIGVHNEERKKARKELLESGAISNVELKMRAKSGSILDVLNSAEIIEHAGQKFVLGTSYDITDRKRMERALRESESRYRALASNFPNGAVYLFDHNLRFLLAEGKGLEEIGPSREQFVGKTLKEAIPGKTSQQVEPLFRSALQGSEVSAEVTYQNRIYLMHALPIRVEGGEVVAGMAVTQDITDRVHIERTLREQETRLRLLVEQLPAILWTTDKNLRVTSADGKGLEEIGQRPGQAVGSNLLEVLGRKDAAKRPIAGHMAALSGTSVTERTEWADRVFDTHLEPLRYPDGSIHGTIGLAMDVTEQVHAEQALKESEARKASILETSLDCIITMNKEGRILEFNPAAEMVFGYSRDQVVGQKMADLIIPPSMRNRHLQGFARHLETGSSTILNTRVEITGMRSDGSEFPAEVAITRIETAGGPIFTGYLRDITERKQAEIELREREAQLAEAQSVAGMGSWHWDIVSGEATFSQNMFRLFDIRPGTAASPEVLIGCMHPEDQTRMREFIHGIPHSDIARYTTEYRIVRGSGEVRSIQGIGQIQRDANGSPLRLTGIVQDVTDRKQAEMALQESNRRLEEAQRIASVGSWSRSTETGVVKWSREMFRLFDWKRRTPPLQKEFVELIHPEDRESAVETIEEAVRNKRSSYVMEYRIQRRSGEVRYIQGRGDLAWTPEGELHEIAGTCQDITERKRAEKAVQDSEGRLRQIVDLIPAAVYVKDGQGRFLLANRYTAGAFDLEPDEVEGRSLMDLSPNKEEAARFISDDVGVLEDEKAYFIPEEQFTMPRGSIRTLETHKVPFKIAGSEDTAVLGVSIDITERKRAELALKESEEAERLLQQRLTALSEVGNDLSAAPTFDSLCLAAVQLGRERLGFDRLALWFFDEDHATAIGSYGVDETGAIRDERGVQQPLQRELGGVFSRLARGPDQYIVERLVPLRDHHTDTVGYGDREAAALWDGHRSIGVLVSDNLMTGRPLTYPQARIQRLYASMLGHLCTRKRAEDSLRATNEELRALTARLQTIREEERTHISHEIHDELGQALTALKMDVSWLQQRVKGTVLNATPESLIARTGSMNSLIDTTIKSVRRISTDLRPGVLDDLGLVAALEWQARDFQDRSGIECSFKSNIEEIDLTPDCATAAFRIVQEALTNIMRHAQATKVEIRFTKDDNGLCVTVKDNGLGFTIESPGRGGLGGSLGLVGMRERAHAIGGEISIFGESGGGATVELQLPIPRA